MNCVVCDTCLDEYYGNPIGGVLFSADGNYGSRVFDDLSPPPDIHEGEKMRLYICDKCLLAKKGSIEIAAAKITVERRKW